ncbi:HNH endonuclease [Cyanobium sp. ATX 6A2]|nr:HNH endonuclease [Cyanobium sp. ATX 6A2]
MVGKVLTGNGITAYGNGAYSLIGGDALQQLCRQRLDSFREQRGEEVFAHRSRHRSPISGSVKYRVLTRARGRCECCGAHEHQRALEVDHIIPRHQGGSDAISNLQALCFRCNAGKRDGCLPTQEGAPTSAACRPATATAKRAVCSARWRAAAGCCWRTHSKLCIADAYPVSEGHSLVIPRRHGADGLELHQPEWNAVVELLKLRREQLSAQGATISGWAGLLNARGGLNSGEAAGQTVFHAHWHLIPRREGDCEQPRRGVRGVIPSRQAY